MNHYERLTPRERYPLILAARQRGDTIEELRLRGSAARHRYLTSDYAPHAYAHRALANLLFLDILDLAADLFEFAAHAMHGDGHPSCDLEIVRALGYVIQTYAQGWQNFCERIACPPYLLWESMPGFARLQRALAMSQEVAFDHQGILSWMNRVCSPDQLIDVELPFTALSLADATEEKYHELVRWFQG